MKSALKFAGLFFCFVCVLAIQANGVSVDTRKQENNEVLTLSMRNALKSATVGEIYPVTDEEMMAEMLRSLGESVNTDSNFELDIYESSTEGLIDAELTSNFKHVNGKDGKITTRKTLILEETPNE